MRVLPAPGGPAMAWVALLLLLAGCRYTFLPLDPGRPPPPERPFVVARLLAEGERARLSLRVERLDAPGYLLLRWYREETLLQEKALFLGLFFKALGIALPFRLDEGVRLMGQAAIPVLLLTLGMQMAKTPFQIGALKKRPKKRA